MRMRRIGTKQRWGVAIPIILAWLVLGAACGSGRDEPDRGQVRKESKITMSKDYVRKYADARRSSYQDVSSSSTGEVTWQVPLYDKDQPVFSPAAILYADGHIVAYGGNNIVAFNSDGKRLWTQAMRTGSPISIFDGKVFFRENNQPLEKLSAYTLGGAKVEKTMTVLDAYEAAMPVYIEPLEDGFLAMCLFRPMPEEGEAETSVYRKAYETLDYDWVTGFKGTPRLLPLHIPDVKRLIVFSPKEIIVYNTYPGEDFEDEEELARFEYPVDTPSAASCDAEGNLYLLGTDEDGPVMVVMTYEGKELWRWREGLAVSGEGDKQPPVIGPDNLVHVASGRRIITVADGKLVRAFETDGESVASLTALADGSLLVAAETALYRVDGNGEVVFSLEFDYPIVAPPVAGDDGSVYVVTSRDLTRID